MNGRTFSHNPRKRGKSHSQRMNDLVTSFTAKQSKVLTKNRSKQKIVSAVPEKNEFVRPVTRSRVVDR